MQRYSGLEKIGEGTFGVIYKAKRVVGPGEKRKLQAVHDVAGGVGSAALEEARGGGRMRRKRWWH